MATINGSLINMGFQAMWPVGGRLKFTLSEPAVTTGNQIVSSAPQYCTPNSSGDWTMPLVSNASMTEPRYYTVEIDSLDELGGMAYTEYPNWRIYLPEGISDFKDLIDRPLITGEWWVGGPTGIPALAVVGDFILNPTTGQYDQIQDI